MYRKNLHVHFVGIGGIGMSGIAEILKRRGYVVSGCDISATSKVLDHLREGGCLLHHGHGVKHVEEADVLVYSSDIKKESAGAPEVSAALAKGIPVIPRALMLAEIMRTKYSVAISGAHGKTTTTSLISHLLIEAELDPTVVIGGVLKNISSHAKLGKGDLFVAEADESDRSLLLLNPTIAVVTNIDAEHLDTYKDLDDVKLTFKNFLARIPFYGRGIVCIDDAPLRSILPLPHIPILTYGLSDDAAIKGELMSLDKTSSTFKVSIQSKHVKGNSRLVNAHVDTTELGTITLNMAGIHNVRNALAAITVGLEFGVSFEVMTRALASFSGVERRFEYKGLFKGAEVFDDYGHHPTEIAVTLKVAQARAKKDLHVIFEPHRYTRLEKLWSDFVHVFAPFQIKTLVVTNVWAANEVPIDGVTAERLVADMRAAHPELNIVFCPTYKDITSTIPTIVGTDDMVLTLGAGKLYALGDELVNTR